MKDLLPVLRVLGMLMVMFAGAMLLPFGVSWFTQDGIWRIYPWSIGATVGAGLLLWASLYRHKQDLQPRHGVILVTLVWVVLPLCAMLPLLMASGPGAAARFSMGVVIASGMLIGTAFTLFVLPAFYLYLAGDHRHKYVADAGEEGALETAQAH